MNVGVKPITGEELLKKDLKEIPFLLVKLLPKVGLGALAGSSDMEKSAFLRQLAMAIASGQEEFLGFKIDAQHKNVIYVSTEDDEFAVGTLMRMQNVANLKEEAFRGLRFIFNSDDLFNTLNREVKIQPTDLFIRILEARECQITHERAFRYTDGFLEK